VAVLAIFSGVLCTLAVATALGGWLLGPSCRNEGTRFVTGASLLHLAVFCLAAAGLLYPWAIVAVGFAAVMFGYQASRPAAVTHTDLWIGRQAVALGKLRWLFLAIFAVYFLLYLSNALAPEASPDGAGYHLGLVGRYLREHGFHRITDNFYAALSQGAEMVYLVAYVFGQNSAAALVHFAFLIALVWQMFCYARNAGLPLAGACAALLVFASPAVGIDATSAYNDVALAAVAFTLFFLLNLWDDARAGRLLLAIGLVAGFSYAVKYTAWPAVPYAIGFVWWKSRSRRTALIVATGAAVMILPWMAKNWLTYHNPVAPFFNHLFPNPYVTAAFETEYRRMFTTYGLPSRSKILMEVTTYGSLSGLLGPVFLLSPVALLALRRREGRHLLLAALVFGVNYFSNIGTRFLIPPLPFVALALAFVLAAWPGVLVAVALVHSVISWPGMVRKYAHPDAWFIRHMPWQAALRIRPADPYLEDRLIYYGVTRMVEQNTRPNSAIFTFTPIPEAYTSRRIVISFQSAGNRVLNDILYSAIVPEFQPTWRVRFTFPRQPLGAVRVVETASSTELWRIHEMRLFDGVRELPRDPRWRLRAQPFPWGIQDAFDNNPVTFWISGEYPRPGHFVEVDFGAPASVDSVTIETAPNQLPLQFRLDGRDPSGQWKPLAARPETFDAHAPLGMRRAAAEELKRRGIDYILAFDGELGADDFQRNSDLWGIRPISEHKGARLYQLP
jgi:hypothetical protein